MAEQYVSLTEVNAHIMDYFSYNPRLGKSVVKWLAKAFQLYDKSTDSQKD